VLNGTSQDKTVPPRVRAYFITFTTYGTRLHGDSKGSVDLQHRLYRTPYAPKNPFRTQFEQRQMIQAAYVLDEQRREVVLRSCRQSCEFRGWWLFAAHIRSNHVHTVLQAGEEPERVLNDLKAYASRALTKAGFDVSDRRRWARHGSTRYLWNEEQLRAAINYVVREQGEPMAVYIAPGRWKDA
jgi:REP element-mobilizing transposase RayT